ncbi:P450-derived glycosyltransferase activator [Kibdelosporangium persicum]|uniref:Mycaminosyltransferase auxiliary protein tylMIII/desosaminyltransferase auxiliary protein/TDP-megosamine glycosyltransferase auxiliary protein n=1 Tax=Kibdelosporangium persicum TaxID=2698649 RepID=A0ABX2FHK1_9PSEU|nr:P450-derived glycosyltransferase activator [Kibdelosporangium persicum]NRN70886.1 Mycaminosyltransferase auxiliary protein tylMIII/desosaminyltransferase auxiliary protein/TDP-megosamine glycosyltransferase auxiliary protein [Kibdelosporangium persicum]
MTVKKTVPAVPVDTELGLHLLVVRGLQWIASSPSWGDPYGMLLRAHADSPVDFERQVRERGPLYRSTAQAWVTGTYATSAEILANPAMETWYADPEHGNQRALSLEEPLLSHILSLDRAGMCLTRKEYERLPVDRFTVPPASAAAVCESTVDRIGVRFDLMTDFARPVAVELARQVVGVPDGEAFGQLCADVSIALDAVLCPPKYDDARRLTAAIVRLHGLFAEHGRHPDLVTASMVISVVGVEITTALVCASVLALLEKPEQWQAVAEEPDLAGRAVQETLRYAPPIRIEPRIARDEIEVAGETIVAGDEVVVVVGAANRDPEVFDAPDDFDLSRDGENLSLSEGRYGTFSAGFARTVAKAALRAITAKAPGLRAAGPVLRRRRSPVVRGILRCPMIR